jgi:hypothetical protein
MESSIFTKSGVTEKTAIVDDQKYVLYTPKADKIINKKKVIVINKRALYNYPDEIKITSTIEPIIKPPIKEVGK